MQAQFNYSDYERRHRLFRQESIWNARRNFYEYCKLKAPDFYLPHRWHLKKLCDTLQALYEGTLKRADGFIYKKLMINMPPRLGKSRTAILFSTWILGNSAENRIISCSYNDETATDFSKYTRDEITEKKTYPYEIDYSDIFPKSKIKRGDSAKKQWALEGQFFNYKGAGIGGSITSKGCNVALIDDTVKSAEEAYNEMLLDKKNAWYTGTFLTRKEKHAIEIVVMTRWALKDTCGFILNRARADEWFVLSMPAIFEDGTLLCEDLLDANRIKELEEIMDPQIYRANFLQDPINIKGRLYNDFETYTDIPKDALFTLAYFDPADEGTNYLAGFIGKVKDTKAWMTDYVYDKAGMEVTEEVVARKIHENKCDLVIIEANAGGAGFRRNIQRLLIENHGWTEERTKQVVRKLHQSENKLARILSQAYYLNKEIHFPLGWETKWKDIHDALMNFQREAKNNLDDAPDAVTGFYERVIKMSKGIVQRSQR